MGMQDGASLFPNGDDSDVEDMMEEESQRLIKELTEKHGAQAATLILGGAFIISAVKFNKTKQDVHDLVDLVFDDRVEIEKEEKKL